MKSIWITSLVKDDPFLPRLLETLGSYGLAAGGHVWIDDLPRQAWAAARARVEEHDVWLVLATGRELASAPVRKGLALAAICAQARRGHGFPLALVHGEEPPDAGSLPTPLRGAELLRAGDPTLAAKLTALAHRGPARVQPEYRLDIHALPHGLLFEAGPASGTWAGALLGVLDEEGGARIIAQATGPRGEPPQRATLEYPVRDIKLTAGGLPYTAWALRNRIEAGATSYYAMVQGPPTALVFGPFPEGDAELFTLRLA